MRGSRVHRGGLAMATAISPTAWERRARLFLVLVCTPAESSQCAQAIGKVTENTAPLPAGDSAVTRP
jgi:hypothetical protein